MAAVHSTLFDFAAELTRSHAAFLRDDPCRVAPPEYTAGPAFEDLPRREQLDLPRPSAGCLLTALRSPRRCPRAMAMTAGCPPSST